MKITYSSDIAMNVAETLKAEAPNATHEIDALRIQLPYDVKIEPWHTVDVDTDIIINVSDPNLSRTVAFALTGQPGVNVRVNDPISLEKGTSLKIRLWNTTSEMKHIKRGTTVMIVAELANTDVDYHGR